ncbi:hypothetical protein PVN37_03550 [Bacillus licheniformis]|nr:hypothetical protein [Bacillus licheniformis]MDE1425777.1 hypothetical protein [Bacillus licheniformis]MED4370210.1 hypothetical protein [Bacillus licheniformis]
MTSELFGTEKDGGEQS